MLIILAWQHISPEVTVKGFKCCISNAVDETDNVFWNGSKENWNIRSECVDDEVTDCKDRDSNTDW